MLTLLAVLKRRQVDTSVCLTPTVPLLHLLTVSQPLGQLFFRGTIAMGQVATAGCLCFTQCSPLQYMETFMDIREAVIQELFDATSVFSLSLSKFGFTGLTLQRHFLVPAQHSKGFFLR